MGCEDKRRFHFRPEIEKIVLKIGAGESVESRERLIKEKHIGREAIRQNYNVQFVTAATLVAMLAKAHNDSSLDKQLTILSPPKLLIIDELGYLPFEANAAHLFFQLVSRR